MKLTKRILVAALALALLVSGFAFASFAEEPEREYEYTVEGIDRAEQILEYYYSEEYVKYGFEDGQYEDLLLLKGANKKFQPALAIKADPKNEFNNVLEVSGMSRKNHGMAYEKTADGAVLTDSVIVSNRVYFGEGTNKGLNYALKLNTASEKDPGFRLFSIVEIDVKEKTLKYSGWDSDKQVMEPLAFTAENVTIETGKWYELFVIYNSTDDYYFIEVADENGIIFESGKIAITGATGIGSFALNLMNNGSGAMTTYLDDVKVYEGTTERDSDYAYGNTQTTILDLHKFFNADDTDYATKLRIADVMQALYVVDPSFFDVYDYDIWESIQDVAISEMFATLAGEFLARVEVIDSLLPYAARVENLEYVTEYERKLPEDALLDSTLGITPEVSAAIKESRVLLAKESENVATVKTHSENFIDFMTNVYDPENKDYVQLQVWMAELGDVYVAENEDFEDFDTTLYPYQTRFYTEFDSTYVGMETPYALYTDFVTKFTEIDTAVYEFFTHIDSLEISASFGGRYYAYACAAEVYNNGDIHPMLDNTTVPGLMEKIDFFLRSEPSILAKMQDCELFITIVEEATIASYYTILVDKLEKAAEAYKNIALDYEGVFDAVETFNSLRLVREAIEAGADKYIAAVNAIADAGDDFYAKKAAVENALSLKAEGDVLGYAGVKEANVILSAAESDINFREGNSTTLISLVAQTAATESIIERRQLLRLAAYAYENCEDAYEGVADAKAAFEAEMERFVKDVKAANAAIVAVNDSAASIAGAVFGVAIFN